MSESFKKILFRFYGCFLDISVSFALNNLNEQRKDRIAESNCYCKFLEYAQQDLSNLLLEKKYC